MNSRLRSVLLWHDPRISGVLFVFGLLVLIALSLYSVLVVLTCIAIPTLIVTLVIRVVFLTKCAILKQPLDNPFQYWLNESWGIREDKFNSINRKAADITNYVVLHLKNVVLVNDIGESLKGLLFLYIWYYIGKNISGITLLFLGYFFAFTLPKIYDMYRKQIDANIKQIKNKYDDCYKRILENIPGLSKHVKVEKQTKLSFSTKTSKDSKTD